MANPSESNDKFAYKNSLKKPPSRFIGKIKFVDTYINRPIASLIVRMVFKSSVTPNGLTFVSFFIGLLGAYFFSRGQYIDFVIGGILAQLSSIVDGADGMLARAKNMCSEYGAHLDLFLDRVIDFALFTGIAFGAGIQFHSPNLQFLGLLVAGLYLLQINLFYLTKQFLNVTDTGETGEARAILWLAVMILAIANRLDLLIYIMLAETAVVNFIRLFHFIRLGRRPADS